MPRALESSQREYAEIELRAGRTDFKSLAEEVGCSTTHLLTMKSNLDRFDSVVAPKLLPQGRPHAITPEMGDLSAPNP
jgi:hypothetical protein